MPSIATILLACSGYMGKCWDTFLPFFGSEMGQQPVFSAKEDITLISHKRVRDFTWHGNLGSFCL